MERSLIYNGTITAEQFLFYEIRIASKYYLDGTSVEDAIEEIKKNNLFQYPTERLVARMVRSCYKRLDALDDEQLRQELSSAPSEIAKQINLYAMMRYNRIVWDFMVGVIGEKFRSQDFEFSRKDLYEIFLKLLEDKRVLKSVDGLEEKRGKEYLLKQLQKIATPEALLEYMKYEPHEYGDVLFLTGVGKIFPFMRSHKMLDSMQHLFEDIPIVMFYPGSFNGQDLGLFGKFLDGHYYRAFNLL